VTPETAGRLALPSGTPDLLPKDAAGTIRTRLQTGVTDMDIILVIGGIALFALTFAYTTICNDI